MKTKYVSQVRKIDKTWLTLRLIGWVLMVIGGVLFATFVYQGYLEEMLATRPIAIYIIPIIFIVVGIIIGVLAENRLEKTKSISKGGYRK